MSLCVYKAKSLPVRVSQTIREEDRDFAQPGTVNPGKVTQRHRDWLLFTEDEGAELREFLLVVALAWRW